LIHEPLAQNRWCNTRKVLENNLALTIAGDCDFG
jgi:hypothetical protein